MIEQIIADLEAKLQTEKLSDSGRNELLQLLAKLKAETAALTSATEEKQKALKSSLDELRSSVQGFEQSHPKLVETVNNISSTLSNLGI
jgi:uncharacterized coiled-coil DUF342 family protein